MTFVATAEARRGGSFLTSARSPTRSSATGNKRTFSNSSLPKDCRVPRKWRERRLPAAAYPFRRRVDRISLPSKPVMPGDSPVNGAKNVRRRAA